MKRTTLLLVCAAFAVTACGSRQPALKAPEPIKIVASPPEAPPPAPPEPAPAAQAAEPPREEPAAPAGPRIDCTVPKGWLKVPADRLPPTIAAALFNGESEARVIVTNTLPDDGKSAVEQLTLLRESVMKKNPGVKFTAPKASRDKQTATSEVDGGEVHGRLVVRHIGTARLFYMARWSAKHDKPVKHDVDVIIGSSKLKE